VWPRLSPGGVVVFDDYGFSACPGVTKLVDEQRMRDDRLVLHNLNGHGILVKR
jgi:O-methyltransferase